MGRSMNWNNEKLNEIQAIENELIYSVNCGSSSKLFTSFIHSTKEYISPETNEVLDYKKLDCNQIEKFTKPRDKVYKYHFIEPHCMKDITDDIAKYIRLGNNLNVACILAGYNYNVLRTRFTSDHKAKFARARELKINQ